jgi:hypothetical protein
MCKALRDAHADLALNRVLGCTAFGFAASTAALPSALQLDVDRDKLPLGDYMWLLLPAGAAPSAADAAVAADSDDGEAEERAAAAERAACMLTGAVMERKTMRDLVGRSAAG